MSKPLSREELSMLRYFHEDKGDMAACSDWETRQQDLCAHHPALVAAYNAVQNAKTQLDAMLSWEIDKAVIREN